VDIMRAEEGVFPRVLEHACASGSPFRSLTRDFPGGYDSPTASLAQL